jgi:hypothetical protein
MCMKALLCLLTLLGLAISSWIPLTIFMLSTLYLSLCFTAEELDTLFPEDTALNLTQTTRTHQQHDPATNDPVHTSFPLHIHPGTSLHHDLNALLNHHARIILQAWKQKQQPPPINYNWFTRQGPQLPTHGHYYSKSSPLSTTDTPSWPRTLNISWLPVLTQ